MNIGDVVSCKSMTIVGGNAEFSFQATVRAKPKKAMVVLCIGEVSLDGSGPEIDIAGVMLGMGWVPTPERKKIIEESKL